MGNSYKRLIGISIGILTLFFLTGSSFVEKFNSLNTKRWKSEYATPMISGGYARFQLRYGDLNTPETWSKLAYRDRVFGYGTYSMTFRYNRRPMDAEVWTGWALYSETSTGLVNEINFGIETACKVRCTDQSLIVETYKNSKNSEIIIPTGSSLFEGNWHRVDIKYTSKYIKVYFDGAKVAELFDRTVIPTQKMEMVFGARVISGKLYSPFFMDVTEIRYSR